MRTGMLALALGLISLGFLPVLPSVWTLVLLTFIGLSSLPSRLWPIGLFLLGLSWACVSAQLALDERLAPQLDGRTLWIEGRVTGLPEQGARSVRFELSDAESRRGQLPPRLQLSWFGGPAVNSGEYWRLAVSLKRPSGLLNPHGPDQEASLLARRIGATVVSRPGTSAASDGGMA